MHQDVAAVQQALDFAAAEIGEAAGRSGEPYVEHARATIEILRELGADQVAQVASALISPADKLPLTVIESRFGSEVARLVDGMRQIQRLRELHAGPAAGDATQIETLRRMMLAMAADIRVVLLRLASRLHTLRYHAAQRRAPQPAVAHETLEVLAPLANRLGLWQLKWELEDLAFRFTEPDIYKQLAQQLEERRAERETFVADATRRLRERLAEAGVRGEVSGRPKHIYSIYNKMQHKGRSLDGISDLRGLRVIVDTVAQCYAALDVVHAMWTQVPQEYDDYIAKPKPNGYRSLHTVVLAEDGRPLEVQIRTQEMHRFAEYGVASHWRYKERSGGGGTRTAEEEHDNRIAWVRQLLAWQRDVGQALGSGQSALPAGDERIYVLTPQARVVELPAGATPIDFAYHVHTSLGHRCRGARVDGQMVPLNTVLQNGQTVDIVAAKETGHEGPSRDWLNAQLGFVRSPRTRTKVRQWFNAIDLEETIAHGRTLIDKTLQREGKTSVNLEELAGRLGFRTPDDLYASVAKDEFSLRHVEQALSGNLPGPEPRDEDTLVAKKSLDTSVTQGAKSGVLVVGVGALLTQLAKCCRPAPPDPIVGFVTRGKGVSIHRQDCASFQAMKARAPERVIQTAWSADVLEGRGVAAYPVDIQIEATDRQGLLRDISEVFSREKLNVTGVSTQSRGSQAFMQFTVEVRDGGQLQRALAQLTGVAGVVSSRRR
ncbi:MAG: bifunctional (p)ppGpp synthetase/guanosine-3',5'-bis(diphosphate) 3'-pyrophosphohydrolase [Burkholderiales bacterium]|nr:bifunctional (p)ppGpp synthetase/guanosine-3',5'-bis(diphosphate) 3'-pyrophosphohydrolase [Burkholderiales bacterium]